MNSFFKPHIEMLVKQGHHVDIACNAADLPLDGLYRELGCHFFQVDFSRSPLSKDNVTAFKQLKKVVKEGNYDIVHCHTPNASVITRLVCRKFRKRDGLKVFYTAHGFHFYRGAPLLNWMVFYPVEKFCSRFTDKLITINREDFALAKKKFKAKEVCYIPGVGIDLSKFENIQADRAAKRREIGVPEDAFLLLSVGELNENKNHQVIIKALAKLKNPNVHYAIAGTGDQRTVLIELAEKLGVSEQVHLLGYRNDVLELYATTDVYVLPSIREGLNVSLIEAMASGMPCIAGRIRGNVDLIDDAGGKLFDPNDAADFIGCVCALQSETTTKMGTHNKEKVRDFEIENVLFHIKELYWI